MNIEIYQDLFDKYLISDLSKIIKSYIRPLIYSKIGIQKIITNIKTWNDNSESFQEVIQILDNIDELYSTSHFTDIKNVISYFHIIAKLNDNRFLYLWYDLEKKKIYPEYRNFYSQLIEKNRFSIHENYYKIMNLKMIKF